MRITHLAPSGQIGGAERVILACIGVGDGWPGAQTSVVALGPGPFLAAAEGLGATARFVESPATFAAIGDAFASRAAVLRAVMRAVWSFPGFFRRFSRTVDALLPQVVHSHGIKTHVLGALLPHRAPVVWHLHDYLGLRSVSARLLRLLAHRCDLVIAVSDSVARDARRQLPAGLPVAVVHNPVDCDVFRPDGAVLDLDALAGLPPAPPGTIRIGLPALFARWKGHETFLRAVARLGRADVRAYVIGGAVYSTRNSQWSEGELRALVASLGLDGRVGFTGLVEDMPAAYRALDIVVHASTRPEPFGLVIAEAMACGRAVIAVAEGGAAELFTDREHAVAVRADDPDALTAALAALATDPEARLALGARARTHVVASFGRARFAATLHQALGRMRAGEAGR